MVEQPAGFHPAALCFDRPAHPPPLLHPLPSLPPWQHSTEGGLSWLFLVREWWWQLILHSSLSVILFTLVDKSAAPQLWRIDHKGWLGAAGCSFQPGAACQLAESSSHSGRTAELWSMNMYEYTRRHDIRKNTIIAVVTQSSRISQHKLGPDLKGSNRQIITIKENQNHDRASRHHQYHSHVETLFGSIAFDEAVRWFN